MSASPPPHTEAYLLQNRANAFYTRVDLDLTDTTLRCTLNEHSGWVAKELGLEDVKERIAAGERIVAFELARDQLEIKWPLQFMGGGFVVHQGGARKWVVSLVYPTTIWSLVDAAGGRTAHKQWKEALAR